MSQLTKDSDKLICMLYKHYLEQRKAGVGKDRAKSFGSSANILTTLSLSDTLDDLDETLRELHRADLLHNLYADDTIYEARLTDSAIVYMENRFKNGLMGVIDFLTKFVP